MKGLVLLFVVALLAFSCDPSGKDAPPPLPLNPADLAFVDMSQITLHNGLAKGGAFTIKAPDGILWSITSSESWLTLPSLGSISGTGEAQQVDFSVTKNDGDAPRIATITLSAVINGSQLDRVHTVEQDYYAMITPDDPNTFTAGQQSIVVGTITSNQLWYLVASSTGDWLKLSESATYDAASGTRFPEGNEKQSGSLVAGGLYYQLEANNSAAVRTSTATFTPADGDPATNTFTQSAPVLALDKTSQSVGVGVTSATFQVTSPIGQLGVTYTPAKGTNATSVSPAVKQTVDVATAYNKTIKVNFPVNNSSADRIITATITYGADKTLAHTITQSTSDLALDKIAQSVAAGATTATFQVQSSSNQLGLTYTPAKGTNATSVSPAVKQTVNAASAYSKTITVNFPVNNSSADRIITATITYGADKTLTHTITQSAPVLALDKTSQSVGVGATSATFQVTSPIGQLGVTYTPAKGTNATSVSPAVKQTVNAATIYNKTITVNFPANNSSADRIITATITYGADKTLTHTITQSAPVLALDKTSQSVGAGVTTATFQVQSSSNQLGVTYTPDKGANATSVSPAVKQTVDVATAYSKTITVNFPVNNSSTDRIITATITYGADKTLTHTITQSAPVLALDKTSQSVAATATSATFQVQSWDNQLGVTYTPDKGASATSVSPSGLQRVDVNSAYNKTITVNFPVNNNSTGRTITATIIYGVDKTLTHTITQSAAPPPISGGVWLGETDLYWATGNLVSDGANGCKIGAPTDGGLYFQWGKLVGWYGGSSGDGTGTASTSVSLSAKVRPSGYTGGDSWSDDYENEGSYTTDNASTGWGDPCRHYLGGKWRTPTATEILSLFAGVGSAAWESVPNWSWSASYAKYTGDKLRFSASGRRNFSDGSFYYVGTRGYCWSSTIYNSNNGYNLHFHSTYVYSRSDSYRSYGFPVRCVTPR